MNNFKIKIIGFFLLNAVSLVISDQLESGRVSEERNKIFSEHGCKEGECEIIDIKLPRRHKRSVDSTIYLPIKAFGREINLKLRQSNGILVGPNTPVYLAHSATNIEKRLGYFSFNMRSQLYKDEEHLAAFTIDDSADGSPQIKFGFIGSENLVIDRLHQNSNSSEDDNPYLARCSLQEIYDGISWLLGIGSGKSHPQRPNIPIPDIIYPEILVIVDHSIYSRYKDQSIFKYILQFWSGVDSIYRQLKNPQYKLSIAGVVIAQNENTLPFLNPSSALFSGERLISYNSALSGMTSWLKKAKSSIPYSSYDAHIIMAPYTDGVIARSMTIGLAARPSACSAAIFEKPLGGIIYEPYNFNGIVTGAHELGHILGADDDDQGKCGYNNVMAPAKNELQRTTWSQCSINDFHVTLQTYDFSCMYNEPDLGYNNFENNYLLSDNEPLHYNHNNNNLRPEEFHVEIDNGDKLEVSFNDFLPYRQIKIFYRKNKLTVTQRNTGKETIYSSNNRKNFKKCVLDNLNVTINPSKINSSEVISIYHEKNRIYVYQGSKPECYRVDERRIPDVPKNNVDNKPDLHLSVEDDDIIYVQKADFNVNKLVGIYYRDNKLFISQRDSPKNFNSYDETVAIDLQYVGSDKTKIFLDPKKIDPKKEICMQHDDNSIYIYQDRKPDLSLRENKPDEIKYLPEGLSPNVGERKPTAKNINDSFASDIINDNNRIPVPEITNKMPQSDEEKSKPVIDITFDSGETLSIGPSEFDERKLFFILFENNLMKVTQIGAPREPYSYGRNLDELSTITSDKYKLLAHPTAFSSQVELKVRHENGKIYFWIGIDELPSVNIESPNAVEAVEKESVIWEVQKNMLLIPEIFESGKIHVLYPRVFNKLKLVSIALDDNHKLKITQKGTPLEDRTYIPRKYNNFEIKTSDRNTLLLHPKKVNPYKYLHIKHDNGLIYVSSGTLEHPFDNTNVSEIIEVIEPNPKVYAAPGPIDKTPKLGDRPSAPKFTGPDPGYKQPIHNNGPSMPESKQPVPEYRAPESGHRQPVYNNGSLASGYTGPDPGYKQPIHNNGSSVPESKQSVPEYKEFQPNHTTSNSYDEKPKPDHKPSKLNDPTIQDFSKFIDDSLPGVLTSNMFNPKKLVVISHKKHKIYVYQTDRDDDDDEDDDEDNSGYIDLHYSIPKRGTITFDPRKINPNKMIIINYINKKIHVNTVEL
ncbi:uncharacterized protein LOC103579848 [Microplitis demolitor]|uniref:uncharacterized protein LOC103579848 n=1 Tax=Microplitis demolitor TaxID=69319 RepID=UPI0004CDD244|nr:uncharacterized protein LOC103579848 [Microplitis demolitor]